MLKLDEIKNEEITALIKECHEREGEFKKNINLLSKIINIIETKNIGKIKKQKKDKKENEE